MSREPLAAQTSLLTHSQPSCQPRAADAPTPLPGPSRDPRLAPKVSSKVQRCLSQELRVQPSPTERAPQPVPPTPRNLQRGDSYSPVLEPKEAKGPSNLTHLEPRAWEWLPACWRKALRTLRAACVRGSGMRWPRRGPLT